MLKKQKSSDLVKFMPFDKINLRGGGGGRRRVALVSAEHLQILVIFIASSQHWFYQAMMMGDRFSSAFSAFGNDSLGRILWRMKERAFVCYLKLMRSLHRKSYSLQKNRNFYRICGEEQGLKTIKRFSPPRKRNSNFHRFCTVFGFHTLAPYEVVAGLLPKELGASLVFCGKMLRASLIKSHVTMPPLYLRH